MQLYIRSYECMGQVHWAVQALHDEGDTSEWVHVTGGQCDGIVWEPTGRDMAWLVAREILESLS